MADLRRETCRMVPTTNNGNVRLAQCPWQPVELVYGVPLCWTHAAAVKAGTRPLPLLGSRPRSANG